MATNQEQIDILEKATEQEQIDILEKATNQEQIDILEKVSIKMNFKLTIKIIDVISKSPNVKSLVELIPERLICKRQLIERIIFNNYNYKNQNFNADLFHEILKIKPCYNILKLILTQCNLYCYINTYELLTCIPKELIDNDVAKIIIGIFHNEMPRVLNFIPKNLLNDEIIRMIINNCSNYDIASIIHKIPKELFNAEIVKLIINVSSRSTYYMLLHIPEEFFNDEIVKTAIERQDKENLHQIITFCFKLFR